MQREHRLPGLGRGQRVAGKRAMHGTCDTLHPGRLVDAQVVVDDFQNVPQDDTEVFRGDLGAPGPCAGGEVLWSPLPPVGQVVAEHGQDHLDDMGHLRVPGP